MASERDGQYLDCVPNREWKEILRNGQDGNPVRVIIWVKVEYRIAHHIIMSSFAVPPRAHPLFGGRGRRSIDAAEYTTLQDTRAQQDVLHLVILQGKGAGCKHLLVTPIVKSRVSSDCRGIIARDYSRNVICKKNV